VLCDDISYSTGVLLSRTPYLPGLLSNLHVDHTAVKNLATRASVVTTVHLVFYYIHMPVLLVNDTFKGQLVQVPYVLLVFCTDNNFSEQRCRPFFVEFILENSQKNTESAAFYLVAHPCANLAITILG
jgi:hypothetical protein